ncbi:hypothetical protein ACIOD2_47275 [Amycolatopsis sp. NPDC088138]|uniref:effector-associated constant component EACC1 n=1 Tax=Amycolatopsis sp. NPDC088138 TaxID=3363938 RepID=UPI003814DD64
MSEVLLSIDGDDPVDGLESLADWLRAEPELRGRITRVPAAPKPGELGGAEDILIAAVGGGGALSVLFASLKGFLAQPRRSDIRIIVKGPRGRQVDLDAKNVPDAEALVRLVLEQAE